MQAKSGMTVELWNVLTEKKVGRKTKGSKTIKKKLICSHCRVL